MSATLGDVTQIAGALEERTGHTVDRVTDAPRPVPLAYEYVDTALDVGPYLDQSSAVNAVIDFYGVSDLTIIGSGLSEELEQSHHSAATTEALLLNGAAAAQKGVGVFDPSMEKKVASASPFSYICETTVPFIFFHGTLTPSFPRLPQDAPEPS